MHKLEDVYAESDHILRYEKGNFKSGFCLLKDKKVVIVNKYFSLEGKINCLIDIIKDLKLESSGMNEKNKQFYLSFHKPSENQD